VQLHIHHISVHCKKVTQSRHWRDTGLKKNENKKKSTTDLSLQRERKNPRSILQGNLPQGTRPEWGQSGYEMGPKWGQGGYHVFLPIEFSLLKKVIQKIYSFTLFRSSIPA
jgi:hypothetical protein